ncbi:hypothetical protein PF003_g18656 [Phytophthora fragariae]|nr:hypothetical protein PF003_g18656 [Phytophthora fragariae]
MGGALSVVLTSLPSCPSLRCAPPRHTWCSSFAVAPAVPAPDAVAGADAVARQLKVQLSRLALVQHQLFSVGVDVAGLHRAQRPVHNRRGPHLPPLEPQLCHDRLVLKRVVIVAELQRGVTGDGCVLLERDRQVGDHHLLGGRTMSGRRTAPVYSGTVWLRRSSTVDLAHPSALRILDPICSTASS